MREESNHSIMKMILFSLLALSWSVTSAQSADPTTIETLYGKTYQQCRILKREPDGVSFSHSQGMAKVLYADLAEPLRTTLGYDPYKAAAFEKEQNEARKAAAKARQERAEQIAKAVAAEQANWRAQRPIVLMQQPYGGGLTSLAPVLGLGQIGVPSSYYGYGYGGHGHHASRSRGWSNVGIAPVGAGTGGVYVPQGNGFVFTGIPGIQYSPTLGYTNSFINNTAPGFFGGQHSGVVPGVAIHGSSAMPAAHH